MIFSFDKRTIILFLMVWVSGCTSLGGGTGGPNQESEVEVNDPAVNAYYLFSEAHLRVINKDVDGAIDAMEKALVLDPESLYLKKELAGFWLLKKNNVKALAILNEILISQPDNVEALIISGRIHQSMDQNTLAMTAYEKALALDPSNEDLYLQLGRLHMEQQQWDKAKSVYEQLTTHFPGSYAGYFFLGQISELNGDNKAAKAYFEKTLVLEPELVESRFELGMLYEIEGNYKKAAEVYSEVLKRNPNNIQARMALGKTYHKQGLKKEAQSILSVLGRMSQTDPVVVRTLVKDYIDVRNFEDADIIVKGMLVNTPDNSDLLYLSGITLDGLGKKSESIEQLKKVEPTSRFFENATIHTALLYQEMDRNQEAIDFLLSAIEKDPKNAEFRLYLGSLYEQVEAYENAEEELKTGLELDPGHGRIYFRLGVIYDKMGKKEDSIASMKKVLELDPENANALNYLGYTYADMGVRLDEAEQLIRKALALKPGDGYITDSLAWVYYQREQYEKALPLLEQAVELIPDDPIIREHLGDVYHKLGMTEKAMQSYRQSIEKGNTDKAAVLEKIRSLEP